MKFIVANWKMHPLTFRKARHLIQGVKKNAYRTKKVKIIICPPFVYLSFVKQLVAKTEINLGAQDLFWEKQGAFTGAISGAMLKDVGCNYVIVGHSERRIIFGDTNKIVNNKIKSALQYNLIPIVCVGENKAERKSGRTFSVLKKELEEGLKGISEKDIKKIFIAYEPIWAVGAKKPCDSNDILKVVSFIKKIIAYLYNEQISQKIKILYGGSVNSRNAESIISKTQVNGLLIGRSSLSLNQFNSLIKSL